MRPSVLGHTGGITSAGPVPISLGNRTPLPRLRHAQSTASTLARQFGRRPGVEPVGGASGTGAGILAGARGHGTARATQPSEAVNRIGRKFLGIGRSDSGLLGNKKRARLPVHAACAALEALHQLEHFVHVALDLDIRPHLAYYALFVDRKGRALRPHIRLPIRALLFPDTVGRHNALVLV